MDKESKLAFHRLILQVYGQLQFLINLKVDYAYNKNFYDALLRLSTLLTEYNSREMGSQKPSKRRREKYNIPTGDISMMTDVYMESHNLFSKKRISPIKGGYSTESEEDTLENGNKPKKLFTAEDVISMGEKLGITKYVQYQHNRLRIMYKGAFVYVTYKSFSNENSFVKEVTNALDSIGISWSTIKGHGDSTGINTQDKTFEQIFTGKKIPRGNEFGGVKGKKYIRRLNEKFDNLNYLEDEKQREYFETKTNLNKKSEINHGNNNIIFDFQETDLNKKSEIYHGANITSDFQDTIRTDLTSKLIPTNSDEERVIANLTEDEEVPEALPLLNMDMDNISKEAQEELTYKRKYVRKIPLAILRELNGEKSNSDSDSD